MEKLKTLLAIAIIMLAMASCGNDDDTSYYEENYYCDAVVEGLAYRIQSLDDLTVAVTYKSRIHNKNLYATDYTGAITIPSTVSIKGRTFTVVSIDADAFEGSSVTSVTIPSTVTDIYGFKRCKKLKDIQIPSFVTTIGTQAFYQSGLESIIIPPNVNYLNSEAFSECDNLKSVTIEDSENPLSVPGSYNPYHNPPFSINQIETLYLGRDIISHRGTLACLGDFSNVKHLTIGNCVTDISEVGVDFFSDYPLLNLETITLKSTMPPTYSNGLSDDLLMNVHLYVPASALETYKADEVWGRFWNIEAIK